MKILITGAKGQLGTELMHCLSRGYTELGTPDVLKQENEVRGIDMDELDIADLSAVLALFERERYDAVINCAAFTNVNACETEGLTALRANAIGPRNLAMAAERYGAKLVHVSTDYVFSGDGDRPYTESDLPSPMSAYGRTKYLGEQYVREFCSRYFILRTAWLYGYHGKNFVKTMMNIAREKGACRVVADQRGNPTNAADLAHHILKLLPTEQYGVYHATGRGECSWYEFTCRILSLAGIPATVTPCTTEEYPTPARRPAYSALAHDMLAATVGDDFRPWEEALASYITKLDKENV